MMRETEIVEGRELAGIETVLFLQHVELFRFCRVEEVLRLAAIAEERRTAAGERLFDVGDPADGLYAVVRGSVRIEPRDDAGHTVGATGTFGVIDVLSGRLRTARATAAGDGLILRFEDEELFDLLGHNVEIVKALFRELLERREVTRDA